MMRLSSRGKKEKGLQYHTHGYCLPGNNRSYRWYTGLIAGQLTIYDELIDVIICNLFGIFLMFNYLPYLIICLIKNVNFLYNQSHLFGLLWLHFQIFKIIFPDQYSSIRCDYFTSVLFSMINDIHVQSAIFQAYGSKNICCSVNMLSYISLCPTTKLSSNPHCKTKMADRN